MSLRSKNQAQSQTRHRHYYKCQVNDENVEAADAEAQELDHNVRQELLRRQSSRSKNLLRRVLFTLLLCTILVPQFQFQSVNGLTLNAANANVNASNVTLNDHAAPSSLDQIYFRNISKFKHNESEPEVPTHLDIEPKSGSINSTSTSKSGNVNVSDIGVVEKVQDSNGMTLANSNSTGNVTGNDADNVHVYLIEEGLNESSSKNLNDNSSTTTTTTTTSATTTGQKQQHDVEDILRQIFTAEEFDEDDDDDLINEYRSDSSSGPATDMDTLPQPFNAPTVVHLARRIRSPDKNSRRGPLLVVEEDDENESEDDEDPPPPRKRNGANHQKGAAGGAHRKNQHQDGGSKLSGPDQRAANLAKYNTYMDAVFSRMNILIKKKRMDPLRVNLYAGPSKGGNGNGNGNGGGGPKNKKGAGQGGNKNKKTSRMGEFVDDDEHDPFQDQDTDATEHDDDDGDSDGSESGDQERQLSSHRDSSVRDVHLDSTVFGRSIRSLLANISQYSDAVLSHASKSETILDSDDGSDSESSEQSRGNKRNPNSKGPEKTPQRPGPGQGKRGNLNKNRNGGVGQNKNSTTPKVRANHKNRKQNSNGPRPTRGILHGLSSLRRDGNVHIIKDGPKARIVRAKFLLGPVALEILPKKGKPNKSSRENVESITSNSPAEEGSASSSSSSTTPTGGAATATAPQLRGILEIRLTPNRPTRIRRLRVFPPGNVQVQGDKSSGGDGNKAGGGKPNSGAGYRKITPQATARLRQTAIQVVRQVDNKLRTHKKGKQGQDDEDAGER